ncbi:MAG: hypothetical protein AAFV86_03225 [Pseudomonadota bacterium]
MSRILTMVALAAGLSTGSAGAATLNLDFDTAYGGTVNERSTVHGETVSDAATGNPLGDTGARTSFESDRGLFFDEFGVNISLQRAQGITLPAVLYDTQDRSLTSSPRPNTVDNNDDPDLVTGDPFGTPDLGRILIAQEPANQDNGGGDSDSQGFLTGGTGEFDPFGFERPDDDSTTAAFTFHFDEDRWDRGVDIGEVRLVDLDETGIDNVHFIFRYDDPNRALVDINAESSLVNEVLVSTGTATSNVCDNDGVCRGDNSLRFFSFDPTGNLTLGLRSFTIQLRGISGGIEAIAFSPHTPVPLPAPAALLAGGLALLYLRRRFAGDAARD